MRGALALMLLVGCGFTASGGTSDGSIGGDDGGGSSAVDARTDWWDPAWHQRFEITLATDKLMGPVTDFPVLLRLPNLAYNAIDLRLVSHDNTTVYPYELDTIDSLGNASVWVKLTLSPTTPMTFWAYAGNVTAQSVSSGTAVFGAYESVSHLGELGDSSGHGRIASSTAMTTPTKASAMISDGRHFDGVDDYLELTNSVGLDFTTSMTVSAWFTVESFDLTYQCIVCKGNGAWRVSRSSTDSGLAFDTTAHGNGEVLHGSTAVDDQEWHLVTAVMTPTIKELYVDGTPELSMQHQTPIDATTTTVRIGMNTEATVGPPGRWWHGMIDEVRLRATAVDDAWVNAEYVTVTDPAFVTLGVAEGYN